MEREPVKSSNIASVGYDPARKVLEVEFSSGGVFQYTGVEPEHHVRLINAGKPGWDRKAPSAGKYFHSHIRGKYPATKLDPEPPTAA